MIPKLKLYETLGPIKVWIVDGSYVRKNIDEEFTNFAQHESLSCVPENEFWIDRSTSEKEYPFYVEHMLLEHRLQKQGMTYEKAHEAACQKEEDERQSSQGDYAGRLHSGIAKKAHKELIWEKPGLQIWVVDGDLIRSTVDDDFTEGGHCEVYGKFIPKGEIWLDDENVKQEDPFILLHEAYELSLMQGGADYDSAHKRASRVEHEAREDPQTVGGRIGLALAAIKGAK